MPTGEIVGILVFLIIVMAVYSAFIWFIGNTRRSVSSISKIKSRDYCIEVRFISRRGLSESGEVFREVSKRYRGSEGCFFEEWSGKMASSEMGSWLSSKLRIWKWKKEDEESS